MTDHDPLCHWWTACDAGNARACHCTLIDRVRAVERERHGNNCRGMWDVFVKRADALAAVLDKEDGDD